MNKKVLGIVAVAAVVLIGGAFIMKGGNGSSSSNNKGAIEVSHELGTTKLEKTPEKVVVLDYGALDLLDEMNVNIIGLPKSGKLPEYLNKYSSEEYANVGSVKEPDLEAINELKPDLIVMAGRMEDYYDQFQGIAPTVFVESDGANYLETFKETLDMFGQVFDEEEKASSMLSEVTAKLDEAKGKIKYLNTNASVVMVNGRAISAFGEKARFGMIFNELGFKEADESLKESTHGQEVTFEYLVEKNPGYLFVVDRNAVTGSEDITAKSVIENELVKKTDAYKNGKIVYLNSTNWYTVSGGYTSTLSMIDEVLKVVK